MNRRPVALLFVAAFALGSAWSPPRAGRAQGTPNSDCIIAAEPNDDVPHAQVLPATEACVTAAHEDDSQDVFMWTVTEEAARQRWTLTTTGIPGQAETLQVHRLHLDDAGALTASDNLASVGSAPGQGATLSNLMFPPGEYLVGVGFTGAGPYELDIALGDPVPSAVEAEPNDATDQATGVAAEFGVSGDRAGTYDYFAWDLDAGAAEQRWTLTYQLPVASAGGIRLTDESGGTLFEGSVAADGRLSLPDISLAPGRYVIEVASSTDAVAPYMLEATPTDDVAATNGDAEPNDRAESATPIALAEGATTADGRLATVGPQDDVDVYAFTIDAATAGRQTDVKLFWRGGSTRSLCLRDATGAELQCADGTGSIAFNDLVLSAGEYRLEVSGAPDPDDPYLVRFDVTAEATSGFEAEPNDTAALATALDVSGGHPSGAGRLAAGDVDVFTWTVSGEPELWEITATGPGVERLDALDVTGFSGVRGDTTEGAATLTDIFLLPGDHTFSVTGASGDYTIEAIPLGPPAPDAEREPNDGVVDSQPVRLLERRTGRLPSTVDVDYYRFSLQNETHVVIDVDAPADAQIGMDLSIGTETVGAVAAAAPGDPLRYDALLPAGDYVLTLSPSVPSDERYALTIEAADPYRVPDDAEPNDTAGRARPIPQDFTATGSFGSGSDIDWYSVPAATQPWTLDIETTGDSTTIEVTTAATAAQPAPPLSPIPGADVGTYTVDVPADAPIAIGVRGIGDYEMSISPPPGAEPAARPGEAPLAMETSGCDEPVAAYWTERQRLACDVTITNEGTDDLEVRLDATTGHHAWSVELADEPLTVRAGGSSTTSITVEVAPDAWAEQPVLVTVRATAGDDFATVSATVVPSRDAPPLDPSPDQPLPDELLGGLDVAWSGLGAVPVAADETAAAEEVQLYDQLTPVAFGWQGDAYSLPVELTVDLAGDDPVPVAGITLNPQGAQSVPGDQLRGFDLELSLDGESFTPALSGELSPIPGEQAFALPEPDEARFARLRVRSAQNAGTSTVVLGEWAVIATPGWAPANPLEISSPLLGGHVVEQRPASAGYTADYINLVSDDEIRQTVTAAGGEPVSWTVGFHHDRAAQIASLEWVDPAGTVPAEQLAEVTVEVSVGGPIGPWQPVGTWTLDRSAGKPVLTFDEPVWARFVRFTGTAPGSADPAASLTVELPDVVRIVERTAGPDYRSALGEWGHNQAAAMYEQLNPPLAVDLDDDAGNDAASATVLGIGDLHTDSAWVEQDEDWFRVTVPPGEQALAVTLTGVPTVDVDVAVVDTNGTELDAEVTATSAGSVTVRAVVEPGADYLIRVTEPPSSIVFAFDTSTSIGPYAAAVYAGLVRYAGDVEQGQETVNIFPFGGEMLLESSSDEPYLLQAAITNYPQTETSSNAEGALLASMDVLASQPGARAVMLITDAQTGPTIDEVTALWPELGAVAPRVYAVHVAGGTPVDQDLMEDWAAVNDGVYTYARNQGDLDIAFDRAATVLRRPAIYTVSVAPTEPPPPPTTTTSTTTSSTTTTSTTSMTTTTAPAAPGTLSVLPAPAQPGVAVAAAGSASVAIIFDTSGSMLQQLPEGGRRIDAARAALTTLVTQTIPPGTNVSMRAFGDQPDSCDTLLVVPRSPLDPSAMASVIRGLPVVDGVRTPIGASLQQVAADLGTAPGPKIVVLVTDGEETCGGDPQAAIQALVDSGIDVRVNIVGFALDDEALKAQFSEWARIGNGQYIDAGNEAELTAAVAAAVQPTFDVVDAGGAVVASGQVGGPPVEVPSGSYTVVVHSAPERRLAVEVLPAQSLEVQL